MLRLWRHLDLAPPTATTIISNEEIDGIMKIFNSLKESGLLIKSASKINQK